MFFMSAEAVVLNIHASRKAEVLFQHCYTRGKHILTYLHVQIFYAYQLLIIKEILQNKQQNKKINS